jgi:hypothetical protein
MARPFLRLNAGEGDARPLQQSGKEFRTPRICSYRAEVRPRECWPSRLSATF